MVQLPHHQPFGADAATGERLTSARHYPFAFDLLHGVSWALLVASAGVPRPWGVLLISVALAGFAMAKVTWEGHYGWWVSRLSPPSARHIAGIRSVLLLALAVLSFHSGLVGPPSLVVVATGAAFYISVFADRWWMRVWRGELR